MNADEKDQDFDKGKDLTIDFNAAKVVLLKEAYEKALSAGKDRFEFEGMDMLISYAGYLIKYLDTLFKNKS